MNFYAHNLDAVSENMESKMDVSNGNTEASSRRVEEGPEQKQRSRDKEGEKT